MNERICFPGLDEAAAILTALRELTAKVSHPVIKVCLEDACADIAHLAGLEGAAADDDSADEADAA